MYTYECLKETSCTSKNTGLWFFTFSSEVYRGQVQLLCQTLTDLQSFHFCVSLLLLSLCLTWGCRGHVRLSCGWPPVDRSSGASSRRRRRIYHKSTWRYLRCCCSPKGPSISSFCGYGQRKTRKKVSAAEKGRETVTDDGVRPF